MQRHIDRQTGLPTDRPIHGQTYKHISTRRIDKKAEADSQSDRQIDRQVGRQAETGIQICGLTDRSTRRQEGR